MQKIENKNGKLFIVATPIGNLADITLRALETLKFVDLILCEDTRVTNKLLQYYGINKSLIPYNDHSKQNTRNIVIEKLNQGINIALVSDAGTPLISDPGYKLIRDLKDLKMQIETIPGPCSLIAALTLAGIPTDKFTFLGFLPHKKSAKAKIFEELKAINTSLILFESANRLFDTLELITKYCPQRKIVVAREITKLFEEIVDGSAESIINYYQTHRDKLRGEMILLIAPCEEEKIISDEEITNLLEKLVKEMTIKDAVDIVTSELNLPKKHIYKLALKMKNEK